MVPHYKHRHFGVKCVLRWKLECSLCFTLYSNLDTSVFSITTRSVKVYNYGIDSSQTREIMFDL